MPRKIEPKECACGCGEMTNSTWATGHDSKTLSAIVKKAGGTLQLKRLVEKSLKTRIRVNI